MSIHSIYSINEPCVDCKSPPPSFVKYVFGGSRCRPCSEVFDAANRKKREDKRSAATCDECGIKTGGPTSCHECCPHDELDHGICLDCEKDLSERIYAQAYDRYKDSMKYGE